MPQFLLKKKLTWRLHMLRDHRVRGVWRCIHVNCVFCLSFPENWKPCHFPNRSISDSGVNKRRVILYDKVTEKIKARSSGSCSDDQRKTFCGNAWKDLTHGIASLFTSKLLFDTSSFYFEEEMHNFSQTNQTYVTSLICFLLMVKVYLSDTQ